MATEKSSFPAVAAGASAEERERFEKEELAQWYEETARNDCFYMPLMARRFRRTAALLRATPAAPVGINLERDKAWWIERAARESDAPPVAGVPAAPVGAPSEARIAQAWEEYDYAVCAYYDAANAEQRVPRGTLKSMAARITEARARLTSLLSPRG